jgi:pimeloyl-ACP methyl ester carboxylesterase
MLSSRLVVLSVLWAASAAAQTAPAEYATFMSQGKAVSCPVYGSHDETATMILLHGSDLAFSRSQARFFAEHGFRVLFPDYLSVTPTAELSAANYRRWAQVVADIVTALRPRNTKTVLAGDDLGASIALVAGAQRVGVDAIAEWSGLLPNQYFAQIRSFPPLLILHGEQDQQVPLVNARQLVRLCELKDFTCEAGIYPGEGHVFSTRAVDSANQRALAFFRTYLWSNLPKRAE